MDVYPLKPLAKEEAMQKSDLADAKSSDNSGGTAPRGPEI